MDLSIFVFPPFLPPRRNGFCWLSLAVGGRDGPCEARRYPLGQVVMARIGRKLEVGAIRGPKWEVRAATGVP